MCYRWISRLGIPTLASSLSLSLLVVSLPALSQSTYVPRRTGPPPASRTMAGARNSSCVGDTATTLTALAPYGYVGETSRTQPTVAWYVPDAESIPVEFRIYAYGAEGQLQAPPLYEMTLDSQPGIMSFTLPQEQALTVGQTYYWQVALLCDPAHPSEDLVVGTELEVIAPSSDTPTPWYDLLAEAIEPEPDSMAAPLLTLIADLAAIEQNLSSATTTDAVLSEELSRHSEQLMQIVEAEQP